MVTRQRAPALERSNTTFRGTGLSEAICEGPCEVSPFFLGPAVLLLLVTSKTAQRYNVASVI
uniref:Uncharacterized protein n=1 Tax=Hyaloperonospora arabidopsidis (strain Emoy2) TaxID=559515 RepID=M4BCJ0_HYAAE